MNVKLSTRGFKHLDEIKTSYGHVLRVYESSNVRGGIWLATDATKNTCGNDPVELHAHLLLDEAEELRDQFTYLIDNHYTKS